MTIGQRYDVIIVGAGPVGSAAANIAGAHGLRCLLADESVDVFPLPRAIHFDADVMRIFQFAGLAERIEPMTRAMTGGVHLGADGDPIRRFRIESEPGDLGWRPHYMFFQPELDAMLRRAAAEREEVDTAFGWRCDSVSEVDGGIRAHLRGPDGQLEEPEAHYLIAADGATSSIRHQLGITLSNYGFDEQWLVVDARVPDADLGPDYAENHCDPRRPASYIPGPRDHRRWEFMLLPGEHADDLTDPDTVRSLVGAISPWLNPTEMEIQRAAVYRFHALVAEEWRTGRVFLAGDAAHQTPPFFGQGMCHGIRDVRNLLWKLAAVLQDGRDERLLDTYELDRVPHVASVIEIVVASGRQMCILDLAAAERRDREFRQRMNTGADVRTFRDVIPGLTKGLIDAPDRSDANGLLFVQPRVTDRQGHLQLLDALLGDGFSLMVRDELLSEDGVDWFTGQLGGRVLTAGDFIADTDDLVLDWLEFFKASAVLLRPDRYVFGVAEHAGDLPSLTDRLRRALATDLEPADASSRSPDPQSG